VPIRFVFSVPIAPAARSALALAAVIVATMTLAGAGLAADSVVKTPDCATLESWAIGIDGKDRVMPVEGNRAWIPKAFQDPAFAELFGVPALEWTATDTKAVGDHIHACGRTAAKERRKDARNALNAARGYIGGNLRGVLGAAERQQQLTTQEAQRTSRRQSREQAQADRQRAEAQRRTERERPAARRDAEPQQRRSQRTVQTSNQKATAPVPQDAASGEQLVADYRSKIEKLENFVDSLHFLSRWEREIPQKVTPRAGKAEADKLLELAAAKRKSISAFIVTAAKKSIDAAEEKTETDRQALDRIERVSINIVNANLTREQVEEVQAYAHERQLALADRELAAAEKKLGDYPETMKGLDKLQRAVRLARTGVLSRGSDAARGSYLKAARARLTEIAAEALPEFEEALAG